MTIFSGVNIFSGVTVRSVLQRKTYTGQGWCHNYLARSLFGTWQPIKHRTNCEIRVILYSSFLPIAMIQSSMIYWYKMYIYQYPLPQEKNRICLSSIVVIGYFAARDACFVGDALRSVIIICYIKRSINTSLTMSEKTHKPRQGSTSPACLRSIFKHNFHNFDKKNIKVRSVG